MTLNLELSDTDVGESPDVGNPLTYNACLDSPKL